MSSANLRRTMKKLRKIVLRALQENLYEFDPKRPFLPLMAPSYSSEEVLEAIDSLLSTYVTMGEKVFAFEDKFASYIGCKNGVMVNSGSSANLVAFSTLSNPMLNDRFHARFEGIIPAVTWSTTMFPIDNCGGIPVLCDIDSKTFNLTAQSVEHALNSSTGLVVPVHLLGNPCDVRAIQKVLEGTKAKVVEDSCEAHGAEIEGRKVGSFGDLSSFSFYFSHHITTIEGGMVLTNNEEYAEIARMLRAHGWVREVKARDSYANRFSSIDPRFLFVNTGFNLRPTEIQGAFGIHQLKKLDRFIEIRRSNARYLLKRLSKYDSFIELQNERPGTRHVWFGYPVTVKETAPFTRENLVSFLENKGIQTRPLMSGNLAEQPVASLIKNRLSKPLTNAHRVMSQSFFFGNHQYLNQQALDYIISSFETFFAKLK
jgi:CDP-6-deoxy-D-xylo-4-hexulose-3-dehydrase